MCRCGRALYNKCRANSNESKGAAGLKASAHRKCINNNAAGAMKWKRNGICITFYTFSEAYVRWWRILAHIRPASNGITLKIKRDTTTFPHRRIGNAVRLNASPPKACKKKIKRWRRRIFEYERVHGGSGGT
ncbi:hypothetical protein, unlikely [Trypanosoma brucei gambiense DAL972]|uniref:Uncharacterized protein n=1 Tax=Trypanosoma brucei gambiense (strain MHOM/CI/86/DAL972) TaxID=679716 RepID=D0A0X0_TRYB9|nr:hypothetical protein, unlikely [Trypanosoma brucei gambiense DAL972]CBH16878.1 hypothetical protein, unlikely [Trypanosoma brucei gambiense DAL972]|eukprot:XP_011779142.1 hypothetical protein, unlikely [Trypanosoma brucei gambiense DAL972]